MCGIASYTEYLTSESPEHHWRVLSFDLDKYPAPFIRDRNPRENAWYGIPGRKDFSADNLNTGLHQVGDLPEDTVIWFQHETAIWADPDRFVDMIQNLDLPKIITFHTLHFQSDETSTGLRQCQYALLKSILPCVDAITVFSYGVYWAVIAAFPQHCSKVHVINHGIHRYPNISRLSRLRAKEAFNDYLLNQSDLDPSTRKILSQQKIFTNPDTAILGQTGFLCPSKQSESLYVIREKLQYLLPNKRIIAVRIGQARESGQEVYAQWLQDRWQDGGTLLLNTWLPEHMLPLAQRAFDINFYWPCECTQSGILAHALGSGAIVAGRQMEGVGEMLSNAGELVDSKLDSLVYKIKEILTYPELAESIEKTALSYANRFSWKNQARRHYELANRVLCELSFNTGRKSPLEKDILFALLTGNPNIDLSAHTDALRTCLTAGQSLKCSEKQEYDLSLNTNMNKK